MKKASTLHFFPVAGRRVVVPGTRLPIPARGVVVGSADVHRSYWLRRLAAGDVTRLTGGLTPAGSTPIQPAAEGGSQEHQE